MESACIWLETARICDYNVEQFQALGATLVPEAVRYQRASGGVGSLEAFQRGEQVTVGQLAPIYLRPPQAKGSKKAFGGINMILLGQTTAVSV